MFKSFAVHEGHEPQDGKQTMTTPTSPNPADAGKFESEVRLTQKNKHESILVSFHDLILDLSSAPPPTCNCTCRGTVFGFLAFREASEEM